MSRQSHPKPVPPSVIDTLIGADMQVRGHISCTGVIHVQGEILGNVACDGSADGWLVVDGTGRVGGPVAASHVVVRGSVDGPVRSSLSVEVHPGASVVGDIIYGELAIHGGGVVNGLLTPGRTADPGSLGTDRPSPTTAGLSHSDTPSSSSVGTPFSPRAKRTVLLTTVAIIAVAAIGWLANTPRETASVSDAAAPRPNTGSPAPATPPSATTGDSRQPEAKGGTAERNSQPDAPPSATATENSSVDGVQNGKFATVKGANPSRPPGVFLLVSNEPAVLYRKKQTEPDPGARIAIAAGERMSVSVSRDELIRVASGSDVTMFYQGQKVPTNLIETGIWIKFAPR